MDIEWRQRFIVFKEHHTGARYQVLDVQATGFDIEDLQRGSIYSWHVTQEECEIWIQKQLDRVARVHQCQPESFIKK